MKRAARAGITCRVCSQQLFATDIWIATTRRTRRNAVLDTSTSLISASGLFGCSTELFVFLFQARAKKTSFAAAEATVRAFRRGIDATGNSIAL